MAPPGLAAARRRLLGGLLVRNAVNGALLIPSGGLRGWGACAQHGLVRPERRHGAISR